MEIWYMLNFIYDKCSNLYHHKLLGKNTVILIRQFWDRRIAIQNKINVDPYLTIYKHKLQTEQGFKSKMNGSGGVLEENIGDFLFNLSIGKDFLTMMQNPKAIF